MVRYSQTDGFWFPIRPYVDQLEVLLLKVLPALSTVCSHSFLHGKTLNWQSDALGCTAVHNSAPPSPTLQEMHRQDIHNRQFRPVYIVCCLQTFVMACSYGGWWEAGWQSCQIPSWFGTALFISWLVDFVVFSRCLILVKFLLPTLDPRTLFYMKVLVEIYSM